MPVKYARIVPGKLLAEHPAPRPLFCAAAGAIIKAYSLAPNEERQVQQTGDISARIEGIARYLGATYPTVSIDRYEDSTREVVGFRFVGSPHANVEFERAWLVSLPPDENGVAQEMHLHHVCGEINETSPRQRVIFGTLGVRRENV